jgi:hypothetical protein
VSAIDDIRQRTWDFALTVATVILLGSLGVQSFVGTLWVWFETTRIPGWDQGPGYAVYVDRMNAIAAPQIVLLVVVMGLCVPKRLFARRLLMIVSAAMVAIGIVAGIALDSLAGGLTVYLALAAVIQVAVVAMTMAGVRGPSYLTQGRLTKTGSGLLHLGFAVFAIVVVALQKSPYMVWVFSLSALLVGVGTTMSFYAEKLAWHPSDGDDETGEPSDLEDEAADSATGERAESDQEPVEAL